MNIIDNLNELEDYLINKSELSIEDTCQIVGYLSSIRKQAINYTHSSSQLKEKETPSFDVWLIHNFEQTKRNEYISFKDGEKISKAKALQKYRQAFK